MKYVSKQRRWQIKKESEGLCTICGQRAVPGYKNCQIHRDYKKEYNREYRALEKSS